MKTMIASGKKTAKIMFMTICALLLAAASAAALILSDRPQRYASVGDFVYPLHLGSENELHQLGKIFGLELSMRPVYSTEIVLPENKDRIFREYLSIQERAGLDTERYCGKSCRLLRYPADTDKGEKRYVFEILIVKDYLIGAVIYPEEYDGNMYGLADFL